MICIYKSRLINCRGQHKFCFIIDTKEYSNLRESRKHICTVLEKKLSI